MRPLCPGKGKIALYPEVPSAYLALGGGIRLTKPVLDLFFPQGENHMSPEEALHEALLLWGMSGQTPWVKLSEHFSQQADKPVGGIGLHCRGGSPRTR